MLTNASVHPAAQAQSTADRLDAVLTGLAAPLAIAVSGGIDSLTLATAAHRRAPAAVTMFHAVSPAVPGDATARVERVAAQQGWRLRVINAGEFGDVDYRRNPVNRCFFCKTNLYGAIARHSSAQLLSGANLSDLGEYRPGLQAASDHAVRHPFVEAGIAKPDVRHLARLLGLGDLSELPAAPCLSSRVETGIAIRPEVLGAIHAVERSLAQEFPAGTIRCRVRAAGVVIEADADTLGALTRDRQAVVRAEVGRRFDGLLARPEVAFAPYRNGSAFLHGGH